MVPGCIGIQDLERGWVKTVQFQAFALLKRAIPDQGRGQALAISGLRHVRNLSAYTA